MDNPFEQIDNRLKAIEDTLFAISQNLNADRPPDKKYYTVEEAARELNISKMTVYRQSKLGKIPTKQIGSRILIPATFIDK